MKPQLVVSWYSYKGVLMQSIGRRTNNLSIHSREQNTGAVQVQSDPDQCIAMPKDTCLSMATRHYGLQILDDAKQQDNLKRRFQQHMRRHPSAGKDTERAFKKALTVYASLKGISLATSIQQGTLAADFDAFLSQVLPLTTGKE